MNYQNDELSPETDCLGIALMEVAQALGAPMNVEIARQAETPSDALGALRPFCKPLLVVRPRANFLERLALRRNAQRFDVELVKYESLQGRVLILCQRSLRQLYGLKRPELHWILIDKGPAGERWIDPLEQVLDQSKVRWKRRSSVSEIIGDIGPNIAVHCDADAASILGEFRTVGI